MPLHAGPKYMEDPVKVTNAFTVDGGVITILKNDDQATS